LEGEVIPPTEKPKSNFSLKNLFASETNPSIVEQIIGRRLSPEARAAMLNASFALMAGRSPYFMTNLGEAGRVGTQTYYNALAQKQEAEKQAAEQAQQQYTGETARMVAETAREKAVREQREAAARQQMLEEAIAQLPPDQQVAARLAPDEFFKAQAKSMFPEAPSSGRWGGTVIPMKNRETGEIVAGQFNDKTGGVFINGEPADPSQWAFDPGALAQIKAVGAMEGRAIGEARGDLPGAIKQAEITNEKITELEENTALDAALGWTSYLPDMVVSSEIIDVRAKVDELMGGAFLEARTVLKGGGPITDFESSRAERAYARMERAMQASDPKVFRDALADFREAVNDGIAKLRATARQEQPQGGISPAPSGGEGAGPIYNFNPETGELE
jgi:hypothetical protein